MPDLSWNDVSGVPPRGYVCGYCGHRVGPDRGYIATHSDSGLRESLFIYICSACRQPTYFDKRSRQWPGGPVGTPVYGLPEDVATVYEEARRCMAVAAYSTAMMACRKLLMHIAVEKGAGKNENFKSYVEWLAQNHYVPPGGNAWVDEIREKGNEANHEIKLVDRDNAEHVLAFVEMLLKFIYEMPARLAPSTTP